MDLALDCEAFVASGMSEMLMAYLASPRGRDAIELAKTLHETKIERVKEVLKAHNLAQFHAAICAAYPIATLQDLCDVISAEEATRIKHAIERIIETSLRELLGMLEEGQRQRLEEMIGDSAGS